METSRHADRTADSQRQKRQTLRDRDITEKEIEIESNIASFRWDRHVSDWEQEDFARLKRVILIDTLISCDTVPQWQLFSDDIDSFLTSRMRCLHV